MSVQIHHAGGGASGGGRTLIAEVTPTGVGTVTVASSISGSYKKLTLEIAVRSTEAVNAVEGYLKFNGDTTSANYRSSQSRDNSYGHTFDQASNYIVGNNSMIPAGNAPTNEFCRGVVEIIQYANTSIRKLALTQFGGTYDESAAWLSTAIGALVWKSTTAITQIDFGLSFGNFDTGSVIRLYGES